MLFRARELREGSSPDEMRRQLNEALKLIERDLVTALARPKISEVITASVYAPSFGEVARVAPPSTGLSLVLPEPNLARLDARVTVVQEAASGAMTVEVVNGTINGASTLAYLAGVGTVEFILTETGWYGWSLSLVAQQVTTAQIADDAVTRAKLADSSVEPANLVADNTFGVPFLIRTVFAAAAAGTADDVTIYSANAPFAFRIVDAWVQVATSIVGSTVQLRTASGGGGSALSSALATAGASNTVRNNDTVSRSVAASGSVFLRRSDRGVAGTIMILALKE